jgi:polysaccharide pyruvyl transferase WcaK-like protein
MVGNGPMGNRGCQAIEKASIALIRKVFPCAEFTIGNYNGDVDEQVNTDPRITYFRLRLGHPGLLSPVWCAQQLMKRFSVGPFLLTGYPAVARYAPSHDVVISLGGDLYARTYGIYQMLNYVSLGEAALKAGKPFIIWPSTIGPLDENNRFDKMTIDHIRRCTLVLCRDEFSLQEVHRHGITANSRLVADPAFLLEPKQPKTELQLPMPLSKTVGLNIGTNLGRQAGCSTRKEWIQKVADCFVRVYKELDHPVLLVPHIVNQLNEWRSCDYTFYREVERRMIGRGIQLPILPPTLEAAELKWVIGKLLVFVGSRTHSTIAAFGSGVPCGCIGFSAKSAALCDMFYGDRALHLPARHFSAERIASLARTLIGEKSTLSQQIASKLPEIRKLAYNSVEYLKEVVY